MAVLVTYASPHGSTAEVAESIADTLWANEVEVEVAEHDGVGSLEGYDAVVLGAPLYMGRWRREALRFLRRHREELADLPLAIFALGPLGADPDEWRGAREQLDRALAGVPGLQPRLVALFGGRVDPRALRFPFSRMPARDARDWQAIEAWAERLPEALGLPHPAPAAVS